MEQEKKVDWSDLFRPAPGKIVVLVDDSEQIQSGLYLVRFREPCIGVVAAVFESWTTADGEVIDPHCSIGDRIIYGPNAGMEITVQRKKFRIMTEKEVLTWLLSPELNAKTLDVE